MYPAKSSQYHNPSTYQASNNAGQVSQEQQQGYNYYYQEQGKNYYYPSQSSTEQAPPPGFPSNESVEEKSRGSTPSNLSEQNTNEFPVQKDISVPAGAMENGSQSISNNRDSTTISVEEGNPPPPKTASAVTEFDHGQPSLDQTVQSQGQNYDGHNQQSVGNSGGQQPYNPGAPTEEHSNWNQQQSQPNSQQQQQQQQQWAQEGWTWNAYLGTWQHGSWAQQQGHQPQQPPAGANEQQQQWSGWSQWAGHNGGQWGSQQQQQPGAEGWVGQHYQPAPGYPQQGYNYQAPPQMSQQQYQQPPPQQYQQPMQAQYQHPQYQQQQYQQQQQQQQQQQYQPPQQQSYQQQQPKQNQPKHYQALLPTPQGSKPQTPYNYGDTRSRHSHSRSRSPGTPPLPELQAKAEQQGPPVVAGGDKHHHSSHHNSHHQHHRRNSGGKGETAVTGTKRPNTDAHVERPLGSGRVKKSRWGERKEDGYQAVPPPAPPTAQSHNFPPPATQVHTQGGPNSHHHHTPGSTGYSKHYSSSDHHRTPPAPKHAFAEGPASNANQESGANLSSPSSKGKMPLKMKEYVARAFASANSEEERDKIHHFLDSTLNKIFAENKQWSIDWDTYPMPLDEMSQKMPSRWDTPSPSGTRNRKSATPSDYSTGKSQNYRGRGGFRNQRGRAGSQSRQINSDEEEEWNSGRGGRGRKRKKFNKKKQGKRFFIDNQPDMEIGSMEPNEDDKARINQRINRFGRQGASEGNKHVKKKVSIEDMLKTVTSGNVDDQIYWQDSSVEGTSEALEKAYLRLTSAPDPSMVRPVRVLKISLQHVCNKWRANRDYHYTCEQFKSIRQDLTIQGVRDDFAVEVYERHARIALENNDREEFNQCQTQLMALYQEKNCGEHQNEAEFMAYRILYHILTKSTAELFAILKELTSEIKKAPCVKHAQAVCEAWLSGNYCQFFRLYKTAPFMCGALIKMFVERERKVALRSITKAYRPSLPVSYVSNTLGFADDEECVDFLVGMEAVLLDNNSAIDCKLTHPKLSVQSN